MMIVILHGMPGDSDVTTAHEIPEFKDTITVKIVAFLGIDGARLLGYTVTSMYGPAGLSPTEHELTFTFKYHDGTSYHYQFTGVVDGAF